MDLLFPSVVCRMLTALGKLKAQPVATLLLLGVCNEFVEGLVEVLGRGLDERRHSDSQMTVRTEQAHHVGKSSFLFLHVCRHRDTIIRFYL